jgi:hypothetical protein
MKPPSTFTSSIKPLTIVLQLTAFMLFTIDSKSFAIRFTFLNILVGITVIVVQCWIHYIFWQTYFDFIEIGVEVIKFGLPRLIYFTVTTYTLTKIWLFVRRHKIAEMMKNFTEIDEKFEELGLKIDYKKDRRNIMKLLLLIALLIVTILALAWITTRTSPINIDPFISIFHYDGFISSGLAIFQVLLAFHGIERRFAMINEQIKCQKFTRDLKKLSEIHLRTTILIENFNQIYGVVMIFCTSVVFGWFCMFVFSVVMAESTYWVIMPLMMAFDTLINVFIIGSFVTIIFCAERAKGEGRKATKLLYNELHKCEDRRVCGDIQNFIHQIANTRTEFSCGLFDLSWGFLFKVRGILTRVF